MVTGDQQNGSGETGEAPAKSRVRMSHSML